MKKKCGIKKTVCGKSTGSEKLAGAGDGTRTRGLLITNQLLYQLSYAGPVNWTAYILSEDGMQEKKTSGLIYLGF